MKKPTYHIFALAALGDGLSGGDRIFIEFARRWAQWGRKIKIYVWKEGYEITQAQKLKHKNIEFIVVNMGIWPRFGFFLNYIARIVAGIKVGLSLSVGEKDYLYSASDFLMDVLPAYFTKRRFKKTTWFAGWYQTAPNPIRGYTEGKRKRTYRVMAFLYWLSQRITKPLVMRWADFVLVNNDAEKKQFPVHKKKGKALVVLGAVPLTAIKAWQKKHSIKRKRYDAVFQGRLHPQKGVVEMVEIWNEVVRAMPKAHLAVVGDGELMEDVKKRIQELSLSNNITLFGYVFDGPKKNKIFASGKLVLHPAFYDSGGMASAEAMAFGIPAVGFDLASYASYYPHGMVKVKKGDINAFARAVTGLLRDDARRKKYGREAEKMIESYWSWETRAREILNALEEK